MKIIPARPLGLGEQVAHMRLWWPDFTCNHRDGAFLATGQLQPSALSAVYSVKIRLLGRGAPEVTVIDPLLKCRVGSDQIPHMYSQERLCLFLPGTDEWTREKPIASTIVPWAALWLYFYELWHATGEWRGGGVHPNDPNDQQTFRRNSSDRYPRRRPR